jgi:hypothetical protein
MPLVQVVVKSSGFSSERYGHCEKCGKHCTEVFMGRAAFKTYRPDCWPTRFGHKHCVIAMATQDAKTIPEWLIDVSVQVA